MSGLIVLSLQSHSVLIDFTWFLTQDKIDFKVPEIYWYCSHQISLFPSRKVFTLRYFFPRGFLGYNLRLPLECTQELKDKFLLDYKKTN